MTIRLARLEDAPGVAEIYDPIVRSSPISFEIDPPGEAGMRERIEETLPFYPWLVDERDGIVAGYAYAGRHSPRAGYAWSVSTSVYVRPAFHRLGVGRALYRRLFEILVAQGFVTAYAGITLPNAGSVGLHEAVGFTPVGVYRDAGFKDGAWYDVGWWQRPLQRPATPPPPPRPLVEVLFLPPDQQPSAS
jgi:phosphinothricin acetyltransferase